MRRGERHGGRAQRQGLHGTHGGPVEQGADGEYHTGEDEIDGETTENDAFPTAELVSFSAADVPLKATKRTISTVKRELCFDFTGPK